jgi:DNA-directed RNA polymerase subunit omega
MSLMPIEELLSKVDSKYRLVIIAAKRSKQLARGSPPLLALKSFKSTYKALEEIAAGKLDFTVEPPEAAEAKGLPGEAVKPTWFSDIVAGEVEAEEGEAEEAAAEVEEEVEEPEEAPVVEESLGEEEALVNLDEIQAVENEGETE